MISKGARWTRHRPIAYAIAREYRIPGMEMDDQDQEALTALWVACGKYDDSKGPFPPFARLVIHRRLINLLEAATYRQRRHGETAHQLVDVRDDNQGRSRLAEIMDALPSLTDRQRQALADHLNGMPVMANRSHDGALYRARQKLRKVPC